MAQHCPPVHLTNQRRTALQPSIEPMVRSLRPYANWTVSVSSHKPLVIVWLDLLREHLYILKYMLMALLILIQTAKVIWS